MSKPPRWLHTHLRRHIARRRPAHDSIQLDPGQPPDLLAQPGELALDAVLALLVDGPAKAMTPKSASRMARIQRAALRAFGSNVR